jgi:TM2 domain-containing membrane protein YozV
MNTVSLRRIIAVILAWFFFWIPVGLHRLWMRQKYWWVHTILFVSSTVASTIFLHLQGINALAFRQIYEKTGRAPHFYDYSHTWLLLFNVAWMAFVLYDCVKVFSWTVEPDYLYPSDPRSHEGYSSPWRGANREGGDA